MTDRTALGDRMKRYEHASRPLLPRRCYTLMRLDGKAFHSYLRGSEKPFDRAFINDMNLVAARLCEEIAGARFGYVQSDEISILLTDFETEGTEPYFGGNLSKLLSTSAGLASAYLARLRQNSIGLPVFDARAWPMGDPVEVANYFVWRQRDAIRNSVQMVGQSRFYQSDLHGKSTEEIKKMLRIEEEVNWDDLPPECQRGRAVIPAGKGEGWITVAAPEFKAEPGTLLAQVIPPMPNLSGPAQTDPDN